MFAEHFIPPVPSGVIRTRMDWQRVLKEAVFFGVVAVDFETTGLDPFFSDTIVGISLAFGNHTYYCPVGHRALSYTNSYCCPSPYNIPGAVQDMIPLMRDPRVVKVFHNAFFDMCFFYAATGVVVERAECTMIAAVLEDERRLPGKTAASQGRLTLDSLAKEVLGGHGKGTAEDELRDWCRENGAAPLGLTAHKAAGFRRSKGGWKQAIMFAPVELAGNYARMDALLPLELLSKLNPPTDVYAMEMALLPELVRMSGEAKRIDTSYCQEAARMCRRWAEAAQQAVRDLGITDPKTGKTVNIASPVQVQRALFSRGGAFLPAVKTRKTKTGISPMTDALSLKVLEPRHPLCGLVLEGRRAQKLDRTYFRRLGTSDSMWPRFLQHTTATGRLSGRDPNFQNMPRGPLVRKAVIPPDDEHILLFCDYSQVEPRLMAHFANDAGMLAAFAAGEDIYGVWATRGLFPELTGSDPAKVKKDHPLLRTVAKTAVLATFYGARGPKMQEILLKNADVRMSVDDCEDLVRRIKRSNDSVDRFVSHVTSAARRHQQIVNPFGRVRHVGVRENGCKATDAFNTLIQGTAADIMKRAIVKVGRFLRKLELRTRLVMTIHDELVFHLHRDELHIVPVIVQLMAEGWHLRVPMKVDVAVSDESWADKRELSAAELHSGSWVKDYASPLEAVA